MAATAGRVKAAARSRDPAFPAYFPCSTASSRSNVPISQPCPYGRHGLASVEGPHACAHGRVLPGAHPVVTRPRIRALVVRPAVGVVDAVLLEEARGDDGLLDAAHEGACLADRARAVHVHVVRRAADEALAQELEAHRPLVHRMHTPHKGRGDGRLRAVGPGLELRAGHLRVRGGPEARGDQRHVLPPEPLLGALDGRVDRVV
mmetsp:Transcript_3195/g.10576  ORF Transcript_3195/g.10576 Transcript_3195/m.10576 type:complete len:204 (-) Transcript_3195:468-1079(-)